MLHFFLADKADLFQLFNLLNYITFRTGAALFTSFLITILIGKPLIGWLKSKQGKGQPIREDGPQGHIVSKAGTPTMGGVLIFLGILGGVFLFGDLTSGHLWAVLIVTIGFGLVGLADDYAKVARRSSKGVSGNLRLAAEFLIAGIAILWLMLLADYRAVIYDTPMDIEVSQSAQNDITAVRMQAIDAQEITNHASYRGPQPRSLFRGENVQFYQLQPHADLKQALEPLGVYELQWLHATGDAVHKGSPLIEVKTLTGKYWILSPETGILAQRMHSRPVLGAAQPIIYLSIKPDQLGWKRMLNGYGSRLAIPFVKDIMIPLGAFFILFGCIVIVGASNAVNLTDGLDGLAIVPVMIATASFGFIAYLVGHALFADYLQLHYVKGAGELSVLMGAILGAGLGFLWFNAPPAMVFMGDTGSLSLGATLGATAIAVKNELVLVIIGGLFVLETVSVFLQVASFKLTGKRIFAMAPIHHHFEKKGWPESQIVIRFWIIAVVLALIGLATLKLR